VRARVPSLQPAGHPAEDVGQPPGVVREHARRRSPRKRGQRERAAGGPEDPWQAGTGPLGVGPQRPERVDLRGDLPELHVADRRTAARPPRRHYDRRTPRDEDAPGVRTRDEASEPHAERRAVALDGERRRPQPGDEPGGGTAPKTAEASRRLGRRSSTARARTCRSRATIHSGSLADGKAMKVPRTTSPRAFAVRRASARRPGRRVTMPRPSGRRTDARRCRPAPGEESASTTTGPSRCSAPKSDAGGAGSRVTRPRAGTSRQPSLAWAARPSAPAAPACG
jgi:hypothetical protein